MNIQQKAEELVAQIGASRVDLPTVLLRKIITKQLTAFRDEVIEECRRRVSMEHLVVLDWPTDEQKRHGKIVSNCETAISSLKTQKQ